MHFRMSLDLSEWILNSSVIVQEKIIVRILDLVKKMKLRSVMLT